MPSCDSWNTWNILYIQYGHGYVHTCQSHSCACWTSHYTFNHTFGIMITLTLLGMVSAGRFCRMTVRFVHRDIVLLKLIPTLSSIFNLKTGFTIKTSLLSNSFSAVCLWNFVINLYLINSALLNKYGNIDLDVHALPFQEDNLHWENACIVRKDSSILRKRPFMAACKGKVT